MRESKSIVFHIFRYSEECPLVDQIERVLSALAGSGYIEAVAGFSFAEALNEKETIIDVPLSIGGLKFRFVRGHVCIGFLELPYPFSEWEDDDNQEAMRKLTPIFNELLADGVIDNYLVDGCVYSYARQLYLYLSVGRGKWFLRNFSLEFEESSIRLFYNSVCKSLPIDEIYSINRRSFLYDRFFLLKMDRQCKNNVGQNRKNFNFKKK